MRPRPASVLCFLHTYFAALLCAVNAFGSDQSIYEIGVAKIDITPSYPVRLCGYAVRKTESQGVAQRLFAKALAIGSDKDSDGPAILLTVDNTGVPATIRAEVLRRLQEKDPRITEDHFALCSSHSHTAPCLAGNLPTLFGEPLPPEHQAHVDRYTRELADALEHVAIEAIKTRKPSRLCWSQGSAGFAANRRTRGGPVDHDLPVLAVLDAGDHLRALLVNYACHCTTLGGETNLICGDWAGYAQEYLERDHPGAIVMVAIGCGADANPMPRTGLDFAKQHGREIEQSVTQMLAHTFSPITGKLECRLKNIELPFDPLPTREQWEKTAMRNDYAGYHARVNLAKLDRGEALPTNLTYSVQAWNFGNDLAMIFLSGEVVVDYSKRLKTEFDSARLWVNAYANDVPCYIPSERILKEGGYEAGDAMIYYDKPARLASGIENRIVSAIHEVMPKNFLTDEQKIEFPSPKSPVESLRTMRTRADCVIELVAAEPLIVDPVAIDWGPDGKLWVVEMRDYPMGMDGHWKPGSRVKYLEDTNGDGKYDKATIFLDNLPFATGVTAWRRGALICAAPDIIYAEATKRSGRADLVKKVFTGFVTENYQARVNSLSLGLDNWIYGANGLLGGIIRGEARGATKAASAPIAVDIRGRDFRMKPDTGEFEPVSGLTQQGRARDDWSNWFGCDNSTIAWHYPLPEHYVRRNPHVATPSPRVSVARGEDPNLLHPISRTLERFNHPESANRITSGCGMCIYRDDLLGADLYGSEFTCEPVHNLVHRLVLRQDGFTISGDRAADEQQTEFLASSDNWCRPVQARTGPDGALYIVDMYRFVIEHPRWIPAERLARLDVRAGEDKGRIYRIVPKSKKLRPIPDLTKIGTARLATLLDTPNGTERDRIHQELICRGDQSASHPLETLAQESKSAAVRVQALCVLDGLRALDWNEVSAALSDQHPAVRANAIRLGERFIAQGSKDDHRALEEICRLAGDRSPAVAFQLALSLGAAKGRPLAGIVLGQLAERYAADSWMRAAILSSATENSSEILNAVLTLDPKALGRFQLIDGLIATAVGEGNGQAVLRATITRPRTGSYEPWQFAATATLLDAIARKGDSGSVLEGRRSSSSLGAILDSARRVAADSSSPDTLREPAITLLGRDPEHQPADLALLVELLNQPLSSRCERTVFDCFKRSRHADVPKLLIENWEHRGPSQRQSCLEVLLAREEWMGSLLKAIQQGTISPNEISPADRQRLLKHSNKSIQEVARGIWTTSGSRSEVLAKYKDTTALPGNPSRGAAIFAQTCATCHFFRGQGHAVGPDLAPLADKTPGDFIIAILDPNAAVEPRFVAYNIETRDGRSLSGIVSAETATTLTLVQSGGTQEKILRTDIQQIRASGVSLMPEGLEQTISSQGLADLIAFIKTSPRRFGGATPAQAESAKEEFLRGGINGFARLVSAFDQLDYPSWMGHLTLAYTRQTDGQAKVIWETIPVPAEVNRTGLFNFRLAAAMGYSSNPSGRFTMTLNGKSPVEFDVTLSDRKWQSADGKLRLSYTVLEANEEDSNGVLVIEAAGSILEPGKPATIEVTASAANSQRWFGIYLLQAQRKAGNG